MMPSSSILSPLSRGESSTPRSEWLLSCGHVSGDEFELLGDGASFSPGDLPLSALSSEELFAEMVEALSPEGASVKGDAGSLIPW